jgi:ABC-2 type transport system permease protein
MEQSISVLLPLLIILLAGDSVCGEFSAKTIKVLLTRAVPRWKVLLSKYIALLIMFSYDLFKYNLQDYLAADNFHPNSVGYQAISDRIAEALKNY